MTILFALGTLAVGAAYVGLGILSAVEVVAFRRERGISRFGVGFSLMAASCGPHHLVHGWHMLSGMNSNGALAATTVIGLPAGLVFVGLRIEAMLGGRGDRFIGGTPWWITATPLGFLVVAGTLVDRALSVELASTAQHMASMPGMTHTAGMAHLPGMAQAGSSWSFDPTSLVFLTNVFVAVTYSMVGWCLVRTQLRRRPAAGGWSLSGLALAGVFPTCALMHLVYALTAGSDSHMVVFDVLGVPASVYFIWVVYGLYRESIVDWNRRPIVGPSSRPSRPSPWKVGTS
ncbi:MAG: hypothetical protein U0Q22_00460 [Acidimicrobiales bacterium]